mmetsp:Transcript_403/g.818  ORF Transcript_403/g.818 Transcript_403/m.818 type:complete len:234 (+) Transcript_403:86-787(+)|eukprot:CAMPEP_0119522366 /NCGR_PEP_ID=MMETSP1344-20130328/37763_1 /TAXON_ID=236787 /ORGANISM="Florenciella parvula, Strain CCMP2471" /LENGTH=233 /DNA_ID=CAMNT_0007560401 /DNA_START=107 /DNA_END=808 /DNA_ORIENTATION=+
MTTAHRPTWVAGKGEASDYGNWSLGGKVSGQFSVKDMPGHTKLKMRQGEQIPDFVTRDELESAEDKALDGKLKAKKRSALEDSSSSTVLGGAKPLMLKAEEVDTERINRKYDDGDDEEEEEDSDLDSSSDEDEEDDEELLQRELEKIKAEREKVRLEKEAEEAAIAEKTASDAALLGNPLMLGATKSSQVKRKWNDDVVFKNQARTEPEAKKRFVNDTIRNDFHRRFLAKFAK